MRDAHRAWCYSLLLWVLPTLVPGFQRPCPSRTGFAVPHSDAQPLASLLGDRGRRVALGAGQPHGTGRDGGDGLGAEGWQSRREALGLALGGMAATFALAQPASAGFGPSGAAVTSTPPAKSLSVNDLRALGVAKFNQVQGGLSIKRIDTLLEELEQQRVEATRILNEMVQPNKGSSESELESYLRIFVEKQEQLRRDLEKERSLQEALRKRKKLLESLDAQPEWFNFAAAFGASLLSTLIMHPVDTIKTRLITAQEQGSAPEAGTTAGSDQPRPQGLASLYEGILGNLVKEGPSSALYLGVYESVKTRLLSSAPGIPPLTVYLLSGATGEFFGSVFRAPAEAVKSSIQSGASPNVALEKVLSKAGRDNIFRSWGASLWRDVPMGAVQIALFEGLKVLILNSRDIDIDVNSLTAEAALGFFGALVGALVSTPPDVITTRIILQSLNEKEGSSETKPLGFFEMGSVILEEEGPAALFTGWKERILYWAPAISMFLAFYCSIRQVATGTDLFS